MKNIIIFGLLFLISSIYFVYAYDIIEHIDSLDMTYVNYTFPEGTSTYKFAPFDAFCKGKWNDLFPTKAVTFDENKTEIITYLKCTHDDYITYINDEMDVNVARGIPFVKPDINQDTYERDEADSWFVSWIKKIVNTIFNRVTNLEDENALLKSELCKKDMTYVWCKT